MAKRSRARPKPTKRSPHIKWSAKRIYALLETERRMPIEQRHRGAKRPTDAEIKARIAEIEADDRFCAPAALVQVNAPLALIQVEMEATSRALAWVLGVAAPRPHLSKAK